MGTSVLIEWGLVSSPRWSGTIAEPKWLLRLRKKARSMNCYSLRVEVVFNDGNANGIVSR
jgi:hypothetical protein